MNYRSNNEIAQQFGNNHQKKEYGEEGNSHDANHRTHDVLQNPVSHALAAATRRKKRIDARLLVIPSAKCFLFLIVFSCITYSHHE